MTGTMKASISLLLAVLAMASAAAPPPDGEREPRPGETIIELVRTQLDGPASFTIQVQHPPANEGDTETMGAGALLKTNDDGVVTDAVGLYASSYTRQSQPTVSANGTSVNACTAAGVCDRVFFSLGNATAVQAEDDGTDGFNRFYMAFHGFRLTDINLEADGWEMRISGDLSGVFPDDLDPSLLDSAPAGIVHARYVGSDDADGAELVALGTRGLEVFLSASLPGTTDGSVAFTVPPCSTGHVPTGLGAGSVTLTGGRESATTSCTEVGVASAATAIADGETTWSAEGPVAGDTTQQDVRLVLFDLPSCEYLLPGVRFPGSTDGC